MNIEIKKRGYDTQLRNTGSGEVIQIPGHGGYYMIAGDHYIIDVSSGIMFTEKTMDVSKNTMVTVINCKLVIE